MKIDAHQHFWSLEKPYTNWPTPDLARIYRDFGPSDLQPLLAECGIDGTVLVQAAPSNDETVNLLGIAQNCPFVKGVVGWVDFESPDACALLADFVQRPSFRGVRPMLQGIEGRGWILRDAFAPIFDFLVAHNLTFDGLVRADQIADLTVLSKRYPGLRLVLDHGGKPVIAAGAFDGWAHDIKELASSPNAYCKISGLWTEAGEDWSAETVAPYVQLMVEAFGADRLMWGSDWPVVELVGAYGDWLSQCRKIIADLPVHDQEQIFGGTAARFYGLNNG